jgi:hypothetical protein
METNAFNGCIFMLSLALSAVTAAAAADPSGARH